MSAPNLPGLRQTAPGTNNQGFPYKEVVILSIDNRGIAMVVDKFGGQFKVNTYQKRAKGNPPLVGERWIVDSAYGSWVFSLLLSGGNGDVLIPPDNVTGLTAWQSSTLSRLSTDETNIASTTTATNNNTTAIATNTAAISNNAAAISTLQTQMFGAPGRTAKPYCKVSASQDVAGLTANTDVVITAFKATADTPDPDAIWRGSFFQVPLNGRYRIGFRLGGNSTTAGSFACRILTNGYPPGTSVTTNSIGAAIGPIRANNGESIVHAVTEWPLVTTDKVYFSAWSDQVWTYKAVQVNVPTFITIEWVRP